MEMTRYELELQKKQAKRLKRQEKKLARKAKREEKRFERKSNAKFRLWHRVLIKTVRLGGPALALAYVIWKLYGTFTLETDVVVGQLNLDSAIMLLFFGTIVFAAALYFGMKYLKTAIASNAVAQNLGQPSLKYSPVVLTSIRMILSMWIFGIMWLFNYIGINYGESMANGMNHLAVALGIGFGSVMISDIIEQSILNRVRNAKHKAEDEDRLMTREIYNKMKQEEEIT